MDWSLLTGNVNQHRGFLVLRSSVLTFINIHHLLARRPAEGRKRTPDLCRSQPHGCPGRSPLLRDRMVFLMTCCPLVVAAAIQLCTIYQERGIYGPFRTSFVRSVPACQSQPVKINLKRLCPLQGTWYTKSARYENEKWQRMPGTGTCRYSII